MEGRGSSLCLKVVRTLNIKLAPAVCTAQAPLTLLSVSLSFCILSKLKNVFGSRNFTELKHGSLGAAGTLQIGSPAEKQ